MDQSKQLKFDEGSKTTVTIVQMNMQENDYGSTYVVHIKETINGCDHFLPSEGLIGKIQKLDVTGGDKIVIEKVGPSEKYQYGYFNAEMADNQPGKQQSSYTKLDKGVANFEKQFNNADEKLELHELSLRVEKLETITATLWEDYANRTSDAGHKPGDNKLPF